MLLIRFSLFLFILLPSLSFSQKSSNYISYSMDNQSYKKGLLTKAHADFFTIENRAFWYPHTLHPTNL